MSRLDDLIAKHCPNGVEFKSLGELGSMFGGLTGKSKADFQDGNARYVSYMNVFRNLSTDLEPSDFVRIGPTERQRTLLRGDVLFTGSSESLEECGMVSVVTSDPPEPLYLNSFCILYRLSEPGTLDPDFAKYLFQSSPLRKQIVRTANGVTRFNVSKVRLAKIRIPVPPIAVQREIIRVLDKFTLLEAELEAELEARRKQYNHYRLTLLADSRSTTTKQRIGELVEVVRPPGKVPRFDYSTSGAFPVIDQGQGHVAAFSDRQDLLIGPGEWVLFGDHTRSVKYVDFPFIQGADGLQILRAREHVAPRYLYELLSATRMPDRGYNRHWSVVREMMVDIHERKDQERIATVLQKFQSLTEDLETGLPAEIAARRKQHAHYRDKLLTFKEADA